MCEHCTQEKTIQYQNDKIQKLEVKLTSMEGTMNYIKDYMEKGLTSKFNEFTVLLQEFIAEYRINPFHNPQIAPNIEEVNSTIRFVKNFWFTFKWFLMIVIGLSCVGTIVELLMTHIFDKIVK